MERKTVQLRLAVLQLLALLALALCQALQERSAADYFRREVSTLSALSALILFLLGVCLLSYVLWGLVLQVCRPRLRSRGLRLLLGALALLPILAVLLGIAGQFLQGPLAALPTTDWAADLWVTTGGFRSLTALAFLCGEMLLLALAVETGPGQ